MTELAKQFSRYRHRCFFTLLLFCLPAMSQANEAIEKIRIDADHMQMNIESGKSVYTGNVKISQGELVLTGDMVTLEQSDNELERLTVIGNPARYNHVTEKGETIQAESMQMVYSAGLNKLVMTKNAHLTQPDHKLSSQKIIYDTEKNIVIAGNNTTDSTTGEKPQNQRVNITLTPKEVPGKNTTPEQ